MHDDGYFDERVAALYDRSDGEELDPADGQLERDSMPFRYVWPSELDLMAQLAGMALQAAARCLLRG